MIIKQIKIKNWMPFKGTQTIKDVPLGSIGVLAEYDGNSERSNWAGKTSFLEAIEWCLFGIHRKRYDDDIINRDAKSTSVELDLGNIKVKRSRAKGKSTQFEVCEYVDGEEICHKQKSADEALEKALGLNNADYRATVCFAQGDITAIVDKTNADRRKIISSWLELDKWADIQKRIKLDRDKFLSELKYKKNRISELETDICSKYLDLFDKELSIKKILGLKTKKKNLKVLELKSKIDSFEQRKIEIIEEISKLSRSEDYKSHHDNYLRTIQEGTHVKEEIKHLLSSSLEPVDEKDLNKLKTQQVKLIDKRRQLKKLIDGSFDGICPITRKECPSKDDLCVDVSGYKEELLDVDLQIAKVTPLINRLMNQKESYELQESKISRLRSRMSDLISNISVFKEGYEIYKNSDKFEKEIEVLKLERLNLNREIETLNSQVFTYEREYSDLYDLIDKLREHEEFVHIKDKELRIFNIVYNAVSPAGIPSKISEIYLDKIMSKSNYLLQDSNLRIEFSMDRETKNLVKSCDECGFIYKGNKDKECPDCGTKRGKKLSNELEILVEDGSGVLEDVRYKSGGCKTLVGSAIRLSAGLLLRDIRGSQCEFAQIDEPFASLDFENRKHLANTFTEMMSAVGLRQSFVVSHDAQIMESFHNKIKIIRKGDHSELHSF